MEGLVNSSFRPSSFFFHISLLNPSSFYLKNLNLFKLNLILDLENKKNRLLSNNEGNIMIIALALLFVYFANRFLTTEGNTHPLVNSLFDMIVIIEF